MFIYTHFQYIQTPWRGIVSGCCLAPGDSQQLAVIKAKKKYGFTLFFKITFLPSRFTDSQREVVQPKARRHRCRKISRWHITTVVGGWQ
ncbi:hypothetical protein Hanom_Chr13g01192511 [Helianthus anomalus]